MNNKAHLNRHSVGKSFVLRLQRWNIAGWVFGIFWMLAYVITVLVSTVSPKPIPVVDETGRLVGSIEYFNPSQRTEQEIIAASMYFTRNYINVNSATVFEDFASAMNMMDRPLFDTMRQKITDESFLARIKNANTVSYVEWATGKDIPVIVGRKDNFVDIRLRGNIVLASTTPAKSIPFDVLVNAKLSPRNRLNTTGLLIVDVKDI